MGNSTTLRRLSATAVGIVATTALVALAANAQRDLRPTGHQSAASRPATIRSDSADLVTDRKVEMARCRVTAAHSDRLAGSGTRLLERPADDIAYAVETRKTDCARYRIDHARELATNR